MEWVPGTREFSLGKTVTDPKEEQLVGGLVEMRDSVSRNKSQGLGHHKWIGSLL